MSEQTPGSDGASPAEQLEQLRAQIDEVDREVAEDFGVIVERLAHRFELTHQVGVLKAQHDMAPVDKSREEEQHARLRALAEEHNVSPALFETIWEAIIAEVVVNHQKLRGNDNE